jgi:hypothetical protein
MLVSNILKEYKPLSMVSVNGKHFKVWEVPNTNQYAVSVESADFTEIFHFDNFKAAETKYGVLIKGAV